MTNSLYHHSPPSKEMIVPDSNHYNISKPIFFNPHFSNEPLIHEFHPEMILLPVG